MTYAPYARPVTDDGVYVLEVLTTNLLMVMLRGHFSTTQWLVVADPDLRCAHDVPDPVLVRVPPAVCEVGWGTVH